MIVTAKYFLEGYLVSNSLLTLTKAVQVKGNIIDPFFKHERSLNQVGRHILSQLFNVLHIMWYLQSSMHAGSTRGT